MINFTMIHPRYRREDLGYVPGFLDPNDPRPAAVQIDANYQHGGGWSPMKRGEWAILPDGRAQYTSRDVGEGDEQDPPLEIVAEAQLRDETIRMFEGAWTAIIQKDGSFEIDRLD
jgi:hypothetical protein